MADDMPEKKNVFGINAAFSFEDGDVSWLVG